MHKSRKGQEEDNYKHIPDQIKRRNTKNNKIKQEEIILAVHARGNSKGGKLNPEQADCACPELNTLYTSG
jgi:hypothetical protein